MIESYSTPNNQPGMPDQTLQLIQEQHDRGELTVEQALQGARALHEMAVTDPLTGLRNRLSFDECISDERITNGDTIVFIDLNNFGQVNKKISHAEGDAQLKSFAQNLLGAVRAEDMVFRLGGDEFVVALKPSAHEEVAKPNTSSDAPEERREPIDYRQRNLGNFMMRVMTAFGESRGSLPEQLKKQLTEIGYLPSVGVAHWDEAMDFTDVLAVAEEDMKADKESTKSSDLRNRE
jgi:diguanylate cyclase (GGDEF)-like protein